MIYSVSLDNVEAVVVHSGPSGKCEEPKHNNSNDSSTLMAVL